MITKLDFVLSISCPTSTTLSNLTARPARGQSGALVLIYPRASHMLLVGRSCGSLSAACSLGPMATTYSQKPTLSFFLPKPFLGQIGSCLSIYLLNRLLCFNHLTPIIEWDFPGGHLEMLLFLRTPMVSVRT